MEINYVHNQKFYNCFKNWPFTYCPTLAGMTTNKTPKAGSIVLFFRNGVYAHTGIVEEVTAGTITSIEGNTSGSTGIVANGGGVWRKKYTLSTLSAYTKYFMPDYTLVGGTAATSQQGTAKTSETAAKTQQMTFSTLNETPLWVGKVTASTLNVHTWAGTEYKNIMSYPTLIRM